MSFDNSTIGDLIKILCTPEIAKKLINHHQPTKEDDIKQERKNEPKEARKYYNHNYYVTQKMRNYEKGILKRFSLLDKTRQINMFIQLQVFLTQ